MFREVRPRHLERINEEPGTRHGGERSRLVHSPSRSQDHRANPRDDLTSYLLDEVELDGNKLDDDVAGA